MKRKPSRTAFSIVELAIVVITISLLVGLIVSSGQLYSNAKLATARTLTKSSPVNDIDGLLVWYETTMEQSISDLNINSSYKISRWNDLSSNKNDATQNSANNRPTYTSNIINGLPVLRFDSSNSSFLDFDGSRVVDNNYTIFLVAARNNSAVNNMIIGGTNYTNSVVDDYKNLHVGNSTDTAFKISHNDEGTSGTDFIDFTVSAYNVPIFQIHSIIFNMNVGKTYYLNGGTVQTPPTLPTATASVTSTNAKKSLSDWTGSAIGRFTNAATNYFNGDIAEIIIFTKSLNDQERRDVEQYLGRKWGITVS